jgi:hypothetical protein
MNLFLIPMLPGVGATELIILLTIVLLHFGAKDTRACQRPEHRYPRVPEGHLR